MIRGSHRGLCCPLTALSYLILKLFNTVCIEIVSTYCTHAHIAHKATKGPKDLVDSVCRPHPYNINDLNEN